MTAFLSQAAPRKEGGFNWKFVGLFIVLIAVLALTTGSPERQAPAAPPSASSLAELRQTAIVVPYSDLARRPQDYVGQSFDFVEKSFRLLSTDRTSFSVSTSRRVPTASGTTRHTSNIDARTRPKHESSKRT